MFAGILLFTPAGLDWQTRSTLALMTLAIIWWVLVKCLPPGIKEFPGGKEVFKSKLKGLGPILGVEKRCLGILLFTFALWMTEGWHGLHSFIGATIAVILMCLPGIGCRVVAVSS